MAKLARMAANTRLGFQSPVRTTGVATTTAQGAVGYLRTTQAELFLLAITNMVNEKTFYETGEERDTRFFRLIHQAVKEDADWVARFIPWLRTEANMRTASIVAAAEYARAVAKLPRAAREAAPRVRQVINGALQRPDEPGEFVAYWLSGNETQAGEYKNPRTGIFEIRLSPLKTLPGGVARGVADAVERLYTEYSYLKYDGVNQINRFSDVIQLVHPKASSSAQADLYKYILDDRFWLEGKAPVPASLRMLAARRELNAIPQEARHKLFKVSNASDVLSRVGMTWEDLSTWLNGPMDKAAWEAMIPSMGLMALVRNLRNFDQAGVSDKVAQLVIDRLNSEDQVRRSKMFPLRFLSAYKNAPSDRWKFALDQAVNHSLANVPELSGNTLILLDLSGSMSYPLSDKSDLRRSEAATLFGLALAKRAHGAEVYRYGSTHQKVALTKGANLLREVDTVGRADMGGTDTWGTLQSTYKAGFHDRVIILTDEQAGAQPSYRNYYGGIIRGPAVLESIDVPVYTFNLAGYSAAQMESGKNRVTVGGLSDAGFKMISMMEEFQNGTWPF